MSWLQLVYNCSLIIKTNVGQKQTIIKITSMLAFRQSVVELPPTG